MLKAFLSEDFMLETETAKKLYLDYAKDMPIFDYHCHLSAKEIAENKNFSNLTEIWLDGDHYKWRALRANGVDESYISGKRSPKEKFFKWAETIPYAIGNPLYHWTHLELSRYFGIEGPLNEDNAEAIWNTCNELLQQEEFTPRRLIEKSNVNGLCTTDDPLDDLAYHKQLKEEESFDVLVLPTFRPDGALDIHKASFGEWVSRLQVITEQSTETFSEFVKALEKRVQYFHDAGCKLSDHGLDTPFYQEATDEEINMIYVKGIKGESLTLTETIQYKTAVLKVLGKLYTDYGWAMQLHIGALRDTNTKMFNRIGPNTGFDSIADFTYAQDLASLLNALDVNNHLPKTIIYNLNPRDNYMIASMIGNFQEKVPGKIQFGTAWWFNDQRDGMEEQLKVLANTGLLPQFIGMLTDSRSFLSYTRHEYFRRIFCNRLGHWVEHGEYPADYKMLKKIIEKVCYKNIVLYLEI